MNLLYYKPNPGRYTKGRSIKPYVLILVHAKHALDTYIFGNFGFIRSRGCAINIVYLRNSFEKAV